MKEVKFNAVEFQRVRRNELSKLIKTDPDEFKKQMELIRKKYRNKFNSKNKRKAS